MCGIYGVVGLGPLRSSKSELRDLLQGMGRIIDHRGPDDEGAYIDELVGFGMRRLSIIDLAGGHQPISNEDGTIWVVCNGEIYNFQELRAELEAQGHRFTTHSDTEVLVHLYEEVGEDLFSRLRGMFALAIWDTNRSRFVLGRDRLGKKPLYLRKEPSSSAVWFRSEKPSSRSTRPSSIRLARITRICGSWVCSRPQNAF